MAEVYAARIVGEGGFQKVVALKRMLPTLAEDERFVSMFLDEGRVAANISSPNVVQTLDLGRADDDSLYLVMELVVGVSLGRLVRGALKAGQFLDDGVAVRILAEAARGLHDAHEATTPMGDPLRIVHRDVSPQNILVDRAGRTRITDFGVARAMQRHSHTQTGEMKGKMAYFAPEQAVGGEMDRRLDVFALGIVSWEILTGRRLFKGDNPLQTLKKITEAPIPSLLHYRPDLPPALDAAVQRALRRDMHERWPSALDYARALEAAVEPPTTSSAVAEAVRAFGGAPLDDLERNLKLALSGEITLPEPTIEAGVDDAPTVMERTPLSTSAVLPTGSGAAPLTGSTSLLGAHTPPPPQKKSWVPTVVMGAVVALAAGGGAYFALRGSGPQPELPPEAAAPATPPLAEPTEPTEPTEPVEPVEPVVAEEEPSEPVEEPPSEVVEPETAQEEDVLEAPEPRTRRARRRATSRRRAATTTQTAAQTGSATMTAMEAASSSRDRQTPMEESPMRSSSMLLLGWEE